MKLQRQSKCPVFNKKIECVCSVCLITVLRDGMLQDFVCTCLRYIVLLITFRRLAAPEIALAPVRDGYPIPLQRIASPT